MDKYGKMSGDDKINPRDFERIFEEGIAGESNGSDEDLISLDNIDANRISKQAENAKKSALHELPANYSPPTMPETSEPVVIDKRWIYGVVGACVLIVVVALGIKFFPSGGTPSEDINFDIQLILGNNVKRNMDGGTWASLSLPADLKQGDLIKSTNDRRNVIALPDGSTLRLDYNTTVKINSVTAGKKDGVNLNITLHKGAVFADEMEGSTIIVETKYAKFAPVGTRYVVEHADRSDLTEHSIVTVVEGSIRMSHLDDPDSSIIVNASQQAEATASTLVKARRLTKYDTWTTWNSQWRDIRSIPAYGKGTSKKDKATTSSGDLGGVSVQSGNSSTKTEPPPPPPPPSSSKSKSFNMQPSNPQPPQPQSDPRPIRVDNRGTNNPDRPTRPDPKLPPRKDPNAPDPRTVPPNAWEVEQERKIRAQQAKEEAARRQSQYNSKQNRANEQRNPNFSNAQPTIPPERRPLTEPAINRPDKPLIQTGNVYPNGESTRNDYRPGGPPRPMQQGGPNRGGGTHSRGLMAPIGDSSSMDAKIGDSSSMDAKTADSW